MAKQRLRDSLPNALNAFIHGVSDIRKSLHGDRALIVLEDHSGSLEFKMATAMNCSNQTARHSGGSIPLEDEPKSILDIILDDESLGDPLIVEGMKTVTNYLSEFGAMGYNRILIYDNLHPAMIESILNKYHKAGATVPFEHMHTILNERLLTKPTPSSSFSYQTAPTGLSAAI